MLHFLLARIYYMWGSLHRNFGNRSSYRSEHMQAIRRFTQAFDMDPGLREARLDRGILYYRELGMLDEARADFDALLQDDPAYGPALLNRSMLLQELGEYPQALADLESYLSLANEDEEYMRMAERTATVLREIVKELEIGAS
jgi:tetratricopeptide (TPR) repeat protein